jgi:signal transduction histidine kinase
MSEEDISKLFRIDGQLVKEGTGGEVGTGLGLLLCKEYIEKNNGKIWAESKVDKGSTFHIILPEGS